MEVAIADWLAIAKADKDVLRKSRRFIFFTFSFQIGCGWADLSVLASQELSRRAPTQFELAEYVWVAANEFFSDMASDFFEIECAALLCQLTVEHHLEQQITQLLGHLLIVAGLNRIDQFIDLLDGMPAQRFVVLLAVP